MLENFKTDIIYYNTASDFELEFNICGCCRMRLFNDKCKDKKSLLLSLSRAVSRSRVIIVTAPLFAENNIFKTIASAIGKDTEIIDNNQYNIASDAEITVIKDSLPLVTEDGVFGGCIIESGPQSLIILTDNKALRKTLMKNLIHPYIKEVASGNEEEEDNTPPNTEIITEQDIPEEDEPDIQDDCEDAENTAIIIEDNYNDEDIETETDDPYLENEQLFTNTELEEEDSEDNNYYYSDEEFYIDSQEEKSPPFNIWMLVISIILLLGLTILCYCIFYVPTKAGLSPAAYLKDVFDTMFK